MPWIEELSDPRKLERCLRDLVALSTLPAIWKDFDPKQIGESVAGALVSMLGADFVHIAFPGLDDEPLIEITSAGKGMANGSVGAIRAALHQALPEPLLQRTLSIPNPLGGGMLHLAIAPIGFGGNAIIVGGSREAGFPSRVQQLFLGIGANNATVALRRWRAETDERRFVALIERSPDLIGFCSVDGRPQYINPAGLKLVGLDSADDASRFNIFDFIVPWERARARDEIWPFVMQTGRWTGEIALNHFKTGATVPFLVDWFRMDHPRTGQPMNLATVSRDLTAQKRAEAGLHDLNESLERRVSERTAALEKSNDRLVTEMAERARADAKLQESQLELWHATRLSAAGHLAAALAHELNQPLTAVTNSVHAARRLVINGAPEQIAKVPEILQEAAEQALRGGQIIARLREFVTRGETEKRRESVMGMIEEASALALTGSTGVDVQVDFHFDPNAKHVLANRIQIQQVLVNLIHNALEAMAALSLREIKITTARLDADLVEISVADSGPGLPGDVMERLFEPFVSSKRKGMGMGLSISRSIVEAHGGTIRVEPNPGGGAVFRFTLTAAADGESGGS
jgi:PAS domain S-box-containing protein